MILHKLPTLGKTLSADTDHLLAQIQAGSLLLIHLPPGDYAFESHKHPEFIVCVNGSLVMEDQQGNRQIASTGEMIEIPIGLVHRFSENCDAIVLTLTQS